MSDNYLWPDWHELALWVCRSILFNEVIIAMPVLQESRILVYILVGKKTIPKYEVDVHAWVLMTNHVHILCTPQCLNGVSNMMQSIGRQYVRYFNYTCKRSGTLWEGAINFV